ncbi:hypothetical protein [Burkholderia contaminans]|uniref:hypothetical protein n=1 Tax=Burkholderia contaminans TaxID=488447 RepID=UPI00311994BD
MKVQARATCNGKASSVHPQFDPALSRVAASLRCIRIRGRRRAARLTIARRLRIAGRECRRDGEPCAFDLLPRTCLRTSVDFRAHTLLLSAYARILCMRPRLAARFQRAYESIKNLIKHVVFLTKSLSVTRPESCLFDSVFSSVYAI